MTAAHQAPPSLGFSRQEHWSGLPFPSPMQPTRLLRPWDFPSKSTGVGCHCRLWNTCLQVVFSARVSPWLLTALWSRLFAGGKPRCPESHHWGVISTAEQVPPPVSHSGAHQPLSYTFRPVPYVKSFLFLKAIFTDMGRHYFYYL